MRKRLAALVAAATLIGCTPDNLLRPSLPTVPPESGKTPIAKAKQTIDAKPEIAQPRGPITPAQVKDKTAQDALKALEAEIEKDAATVAGKE